MRSKMRHLDEDALYRCTYHQLIPNYTPKDVYPIPRHLLLANGI
jgi:hypothetical protein